MTETVRTRHARPIVHFGAKHGWIGWTMSARGIWEAKDTGGELWQLKRHRLEGDADNNGWHLYGPDGEPDGELMQDAGAVLTRPDAFDAAAVYIRDHTGAAPGASRTPCPICGKPMSGRTSPWIAHMRTHDEGRRPGRQAGRLYWRAITPKWEWEYAPDGITGTGPRVRLTRTPANRDTLTVYSARVQAPGQNPVRLLATHVQDAQAEAEQVLYAWQHPEVPVRDPRERRWIHTVDDREWEFAADERDARSPRQWLTRLGRAEYAAHTDLTAEPQTHGFSASTPAQARARAEEFFEHTQIPPDAS